MFIDEAQIIIQAGKGGDGAVSFRRERYVPRGGPDGGDGGNGGDVIFIGKHDLHTLSSFRAKKDFRAEEGENGMRKNMFGKAGRDTIIEVPLGTVIHKYPVSDQGLTLQPIEVLDIVNDGQHYLAAKGGNGGWGNSHFATSIKQAPQWSKQGLPGEQFTVHLELNLIADVGLVGLPNAGKSTFLSVVSNARPKIANYPFTTTEPQLGVASVHGRPLVIADIPGLIEGAAEGKGLGHAFLKHIRRTRLLLFLLDGTNEDAEHDLKTLQSELKRFDPALTKKPHLLAINKMDIISQERQRDLEKRFSQAFFISGATHAGIDELLLSVAKKLDS